MKKHILPLAALLLCACMQATPIGTGGASSSSVTSSSSASSVASQTYRDAQNGYSIDHPAALTMKENDEVITADAQIHGTSFLFPGSYSDGNTLNEAKVNVARQAACPASQSGMPSHAKENIIVNGTTFEKTGWSGVGAGNLYQGTMYTTMHNNSCYILTLFMHSCNLGPDCSAGHTKPFDKQLLTNVFESMVRSFKML